VPSCLCNEGPVSPQFLTFRDKAHVSQPPNQMCAAPRSNDGSVDVARRCTFPLMNAGSGPSQLLEPEEAVLRPAVAESRPSSPRSCGTNNAPVGAKQSITTTCVEKGSQPPTVPLGRFQSRIPVELWKPRKIRKWKSPLLMLGFFIGGLSFSVAHCAFYPSLNGKVVGDPRMQEENIRYV
jgi:hypothetical protein